MMTTPTNSLNFKTGYADVNGLTMYYEIHGKGKPLVLIHGGAQPLKQVLARSYHNSLKTGKSLL